MGSTLDTLWSKLSDWGRQFIEILPNIAAAMVVIVIFGLLSRVVSRLAKQGLYKLTGHQTLVRLGSTIARIAVILGGVFIALGILDLRTTVTSLLAGVGVVGLALGFAFQDMAANFMSGVFMAVRRPFEVGDMVVIHEVFGTVEDIGLRSTTLRNFEGQICIVPNKDVLQNEIRNYHTTGERRVDVDIGVSYGDSLREARKVAIEAIEGLAFRDPDREVTAIYEGYADSSIKLSVRFWIKVPETSFLDARSEGVMVTKEAFDAAGLTIPFPIRSLDFGIVGGQRLDEIAPRLTQRVS